jgi:signal transduction histidine kinase/putative methionine-R-sulfoxide reductase with GAF domain
MGRRAKSVKGRTESKRSSARTASKDNSEVSDLKQRLAEALEQQTATADILRIISGAPTDVHPALDALIESVTRLCGADTGVISQFDGQVLRPLVHSGASAEVRAFWQENPIHPDRGSVTGRVAIERRTIHVPDVLADSGYELGQGQKVTGYRTVLIAPMLRGEAFIGVVGVWRTQVRPFTEHQVKLIEVFADQAVIAIENARLLSELQEKNTSLTQAFDQQTATSEILRVISSSPTDTQPVFDSIAASALRLCEAKLCTVFRFDGTLIHLVAGHHVATEGAAAYRDVYPAPPGRAGGTHRAILTRRIIHIPDIREDPEYELTALARANDFGCVLAVPMLRDGQPIGAITVGREAGRGFVDEQIELLKTFADQAVIAIENVRLFTELQTSNRELTTALDTQTATSDILRVISGSRTDVQPVFDAIMTSALRLLRAYSGTLTRLVGEQIEIAAISSTSPEGDAALRTRFPQPLHSAGPHARTIRERAPLNVADTHTDQRLPDGFHAYARVRGYRSQVVVPMLHYGEAVGTISVTRREPGGFTDDEIALLKTFADQAVIAIENARLLSELQARTDDLSRSVGELRALSEIGQAIGSTLDLQTVLATIVARATDLAGADAGAIYEYDVQREVFEPRASERLEGEIVQELVATPIRKGQGVTGRLAEVFAPIQTADIRVGDRILVRELLIRAGYRALLAVPLVREGLLIGGLTVFRKTPGEYAANVVELMQTFATQSALAIQNARLFREVEIKSRELEVASQHKSEFLASMSHELRTPLNAIIGFSDVLLQGMFGEMSEKQTEYLQDILASGQHLLSLINDILDLSKIEAGRMDLDLADFHLPSAIDDALLLMRERASRRGLALKRHVDERLGEIRADQRKVKQVLLNLLSNAVKFTPEGGRIDMRAVLADGTVEISVTDTGIGIAPEDQETVFEEFRQVGHSERKAEGTGLGLALCRKFVELHGGRIWVKSQIGQGSTFTFTLPVRQGDGSVPLH